jgi:hypothetical protein
VEGAAKHAKPDCHRIDVSLFSVQPPLAKVMFMLFPRSEQYDICIANCEHGNATAMAERNDQLSKVSVLLRSTTGMERERDDTDRALQCVAASLSVKSWRPY